MFGPGVKVCCGPRCGAEPGHRLIYDAIERAADTLGLTVRPAMCLGLCGSGVTAVLPGGEKCKVREAREAADVLRRAATFTEDK